MTPSSFSNAPPILRNPIVLAGIGAVVIALFVFIGATIFGSDDSSGKSESAIAIATVTATPTLESLTGDGLKGKAKATIDVHSAPYSNSMSLATLRKGVEVKIVAKNDDGDWLQIVYPPGSELFGWVAVASLEIEGDITGLAVATPESLPQADVPTSQPLKATPTPNATIAPTATPLPPLPDLVVGGFLVSGQTLVVTITNQGSGPVSNAYIDVSVFDVTGAQSLNTVTVGPVNLQPGASLDVKTGYNAIKGAAQVLVIIDAGGKVAETDDTNNRLVVSFATPGASPSPAATATATRSP